MVPAGVLDATTWEPPRELLGFELLRPLGQGGMGKVYLARDRGLDRLVALKFMTVAASLPGARERFVAEARALARLNHPNVVGVFRVDEFDGHPFIAYEYVRGESLDYVLKPVRWQTSLTIGIMAARALAAAHRAGVLHRDLKPANIIISPEGTAKLLDFGLARFAAAEELEVRVDHASKTGPARAELDSGYHLTAPGFVVGTPRYWAPELWEGAPATPASDVYGLGLVVYELLSGSLPFAELAGEDLFQALVAEEVAPLEADLVPRPLAEVIERCLRRDPAARFASGAELALALERVEEELPQSGPREMGLLTDKNVVIASWSRLVPVRDQLAARLYEELMKARPDLRAILPRDVGALESKMLETLELVARNLHEPERITPTLHQLGRKHLAYRIDPAHLDAFGRALRKAIAELDPEWSDEVDAGWEHAYGFIASALRVGMRASSAGSTPPVTLRAPGAATPSVRIEPPRTSYARVGRKAVAYQVFGSGPPNLVFMPGLLTHVEATWGHPFPVTLLSDLARFSRVAIFDRRGSGLSSSLERPSLDDGVVDIAAVMSAAKMTRAIIVAAGYAVGLGIRFAATNPELTEGLVLFGGAARTSVAPDYPQGRTPERWNAIAKSIRDHWGESSFGELDELSARGDAAFAAWLTSYSRQAASSRAALEHLRFVQEMDERASLPRVLAPTLVLRRKGDLGITPEEGRALAAQIPRAQLVELEGDDHLVFAGDVTDLAREIERFAAGLGGTAIAAKPVERERRVRTKAPGSRPSPGR